MFQDFHKFLLLMRCSLMLLQQIADEIRKSGVPEEQIIDINFEDFQYSDITTAKKLYDFIREKRKRIWQNI